MVGEGEVKRPTLERVRDVRMRYDLRDYIAQELRIGTRNARGRYIQVKCPFHEDNDPSMAVYERNYYCHGCRAHGDIIDWIRHRDGSNFFTALEMLEGIGSHQAGPGVRPWVVQSEHEVQSTVGADRLRSTLASIIKAGMENMMGSPAATYCQSRGWDRNIQGAYRLGYVDIHSEDLGFFGGKDSFEEIGLLYKSGHPWISRRLLIPLLDTFGNPVALATRTIDGDDGPRYINSRRSPLFRRDEMIYGSEWVKVSLKPYFLVVEGYADVWSLYRVGVPAIAVMSDRMSEFQHNWIASYAHRTRKRVVMAFDGDAAGQEGEQLCWSRLAAEDVSVSRLWLRDGLDVSEIIEKQGERAIKGLLAHIEGGA